jgi:hypothetical protein
MDALSKFLKMKGRKDWSALADDFRPFLLCQPMISHSETPPYGQCIQEVEVGWGAASAPLRWVGFASLRRRYLLTLAK